MDALLAAAAVKAEELGLESAEAAILQAVEELGALGKVSRRFGCSRAAVQAWIRTDPERLRPLIKEARRQAADIAAEEAGDVLDDLPLEPTSPQVQAANSKSNYKRWLAGVWSEDYRDQKAGVQVNVDIGQLHLEALRSEGVRRVAVTVPAGPEAVEEAELVEDDG